MFSALTATLSTHYEYLRTLVSWADERGIPAEDAEHYVRGLFQGIGRALGDETVSLEQLAAGHETPNGVNERIRTTWFDPPNVRTLTGALPELRPLEPRPSPVAGARFPRPRLRAVRLRILDVRFPP